MQERGTGPALSDPGAAGEAPPSHPASPASAARLAPLVGAVAGTVVVLDQLTKAWAMARLPGDPVDLGPVTLALTRNSGAAFGLGGGLAPVLVLVAIALIVVLLRGSGIVTGRLAAVAVGLVLGGALGNLADRLVRDGGWLRGEVVDFVDLGWWPSFNLADAAITVGAAVLVVGGWVRGGRDDREPRA